MGRRSQYPEEFRQRAAQLVLDSHRSIRDVAGELGCQSRRRCATGSTRRSGSGPVGWRRCRVMSGWGWRGCVARSLSSSSSGRS